jgi:uncharacterized protein YndB with AHSA1/START domain
MANNRETSVMQDESVDIVITRVFNAPRDLVYKAWSEAERLAKWWGPRDFTWISGTLDFRPGGIFHYWMKSPDGQDMWGKFEYREIVAPHRLVFTNSHSDQAAKTVRAPFSEDWPLEILNVLTFKERDGKTIIEIRGTPVVATEKELQAFRDMHKSVQEGFKRTFDQLDEYLASAAEGSEEMMEYEKEVTIERLIYAPRALVFKAWIDAKQLAQWWGPTGFSNPVCEFDARPGGTLRIDMRAPDGTVYPMTGVVREIVIPERLVFTSVALNKDGNPMFENLNIVTFTDQGNKTGLSVTAKVVKTTAEGLPYISGMDEGWMQSIDRVESYVMNMRR